MISNRPMPPHELFKPNAREFLPAPRLASWAQETFIVSGSELENEDHEHLRDAHIAFVWTTVPAQRHMNQIVGQAERPKFQGAKWSKRRQEQQLEEWFGSLPDFLITIDASYAASCDDVSFCSLVEHELYHCAQERDDYGAPKFNSMGLPVFGIRGHDVEEFVGIVRRYGVGAAAGQTLALVEAAKRGPQIAAAKVSAACGSCAALIS
jgi:hypothetical protein